MVVGVLCLFPPIVYTFNIFKIFISFFLTEETVLIGLFSKYFTVNTGCLIMIA